MQNTIMLGSFVALLELGSVALAIAETNSPATDAAPANQEAHKEGRGDRIDRREPGEHARDRRDDANEQRRESREEHDVSRERYERR